LNIVVVTEIKNSLVKNNSGIQNVRIVPPLRVLYPAREGTNKQYWQQLQVTEYGIILKLWDRRMNVPKSKISLIETPWQRDALIDFARNLQGYNTKQTHSFQRFLNPWH
jgi:hypothetical protein